MPASVSRAIIHARRGLGRVDVAHDARDELATRRRGRGSGAWSSTAIGKPRAGRDLVGGAQPGSRKAAPVACEYSRATPRIDSA